MKLKFGLFFNIMLVKIGVRTYDTTYTLHSHFSEILNPWVHTSEYASVCCAFGNVYHPGHPKVTISYFASFYLSHSISSISYFSFSDDFFINLLFCTFCNFSGSNPRCLCSTQSICSDPPKAHITIGFSISSAICTQIYLCLLFPISKF